VITYCHSLEAGLKAGHIGIRASLGNENLATLNSSGVDEDSPTAKQQRIVALEIMGEEDCTTQSKHRARDRKGEA